MRLKLGIRGHDVPGAPFESIDEFIKGYKKFDLDYLQLVYKKAFRDFEMEPHFLLEMADRLKDNDIRVAMIGAYFNKKLMAKTHVQYVFGTDRIVHTATDNSLSSYCINKEGSCYKEGPIRFSIYDRIGGGDAFSSGIIHGLLKDFAHPKYALKFGLATSVLKHTVYGDASTLSEEEVTEFINSNGNAAVQR